MTKKEIMAALERGAYVLVTRDRCSIKDVTVPRKYIDALLDADRLDVVQKYPGIGKLYKLAVASVAA